MEFKESNFKPKKSILNAFLVKRSSKVEPHPTASNGSGRVAADYEEPPMSDDKRRLNPSHHTSVSANSTPIKRLYNIGKLNKIWRCYYSTQSVNSSTDTPYPSTSILRRKKTKEHRNRDDRHSHPIRVAHENGQYADKAAGVSSGYSDYELFCNDKANGRIEAIRDQSPSENGGSTVFKSAVEVHTYHDEMNTLRESAQFNGGSSRSGDDESSQSPKSPASNSEITFFANRETTGAFAADRPVQSIAMSACRSRLRQKLMPPSSSVDGATMQREQNLSFPNISDKDKSIDAFATPQHRNSRSYSYDMLTNAAKRTGRTESLAKNSLMAAQLINLIPTEVARERYTPYKHSHIHKFIILINCSVTHDRELVKSLIYAHVYDLAKIANFSLPHRYRSYLANNLSVNSLLGPSELDRVIAGREIRIFVGTWNMNGSHPPKWVRKIVKTIARHSINRNSLLLIIAQTNEWFRSSGEHWARPGLDCDWHAGIVLRAFRMGGDTAGDARPIACDVTLD